jgi:hypothetical protein
MVGSVRFKLLDRIHAVEPSAKRARGKTESFTVTISCLPCVQYCQCKFERALPDTFCSRLTLGWRC